MKFGKVITGLSAYARPEAHLTQQTYHGAIVTVCGVLLATYLFIHETGQFWGLHTVSKMSVDMERRHGLPIYVDISFPAMPCAVLSVDVLDVSGTSENDASFAKHMTVHKMRLDANGKRIGRKEYHTPQSQQIMDDGMGGGLMNINVPKAMQHLQDMEAEADAHEGCHLSCTFLVKRVAGRIHISVHEQMVFRVLPQLLAGHHIPKVLNMTHHIERISFGPPFPGQVTPLDGYLRTLEKEPAQFKYFLKVVPTEYYSRLGGVTETHQYSVTEYSTPISTDGRQSPSLDLMYDLSPIVVTINARPPSILHYIVRISAVVGGAFALTRMLDRQVHWLVSFFAKA